MDSIYKQTRMWMNNRGANNGNADNWGGGGFQSGRDPGPERSSLAGWSSYADTSRRSLASNDIPADPQGSFGSRVSRWNSVQSEWNETRGVGPQGLSGPSNMASWAESKQMQQHHQKSPQMQMQMKDFQVPQAHRQREDFLRGFNSAGRDWYYRYLEMGCTPEDARERVLDRNRNHPESLDSSRMHGGRIADAAKAQVERRNPTNDDGRRRPPKSTVSAVSSDVISALSSSARRWYNRHLESGCSPEEALAKVVDYKKKHHSGASVESSTPTRGQKRPIEPGHARDDPKKPRKEENRLPVAIVAKGYPKRILHKPDLRKIEDALVEEMKKGWSHSLNFGGITYHPGIIVVTCLDKGSKAWLEQKLPVITAKIGQPLRIYRKTEIPDTKGISVFVPCTTSKESDEVTLRFLKEQNTDLLSDHWEIVRPSKPRANIGKVMTIRLSDKSLDLLKKRGMSVSYRFVQLFCHVLKVPVYSSRKKAKKQEQNPASSAANAPASAPAPEIDLTGEDEDLEISEMTVLDEVQGDDDDKEGEETVGECDQGEDEEDVNGEEDQNEEEINNEQQEEEEDVIKEQQQEEEDVNEEQQQEEEDVNEDQQQDEGYINDDDQEEVEEVEL